MSPCLDTSCLDKYALCPRQLTLFSLLKKQHRGQLERFRYFLEKSSTRAARLLRTGKCKNYFRVTSLILMKENSPAYFKFNFALKPKIDRLKSLVTGI